MRTNPRSLQLIGWTHGPSVPASHGALDPVRADALRELLRHRGIPALVLATCHRFEVYWTGTGAESALVTASITDAIGPVNHEPPTRLSDDDAVAHAMAVASGLRSLRRGEPEILGQLRTAWRLSQAASGSSSELDEAMRHIISAARHIRRHLGDEAQESIGSATVRLLADELTHHDADRALSVLIIGAGAVGESVAAALQHARRSHLLPNIRTVAITNRTDARAHSLAQRTDAHAVTWSSWEGEFAQADIVIASARCAQPLITRELATAAMSHRSTRATWIDLASPPNIAHDAAANSAVGNRAVRRSLHDLPSSTVDGPDPAQAALAHEIARYRTDRARRAQFARPLAPAPTLRTVAAVA